jgi:hypothetical protein
MGDETMDNEYMGGGKRFWGLRANEVVGQAGR